MSSSGLVDGSRGGGASLEPLWELGRGVEDIDTSREVEGEGGDGRVNLVEMRFAIWSPFQGRGSSQHSLTVCLLPQTRPGHFDYLVPWARQIRGRR